MKLAIHIYHHVESDTSDQLNFLTERITEMSASIDALNAAVQAVKDDVAAVQAAIQALKGLVQSLRDQLAQGALDQAAIDAATASLSQVDSDLDAATAPSE